MIRQLLYPRWSAALPVDVLPVKLQTGTVSRLGCFLFRHDFFTFGRTIHTRVTDAVLHVDRHAPIVRHKLTHVMQQADGKWAWLWKYLTRKSFRQQMEAEGVAAQTGEWPQW